jgi:molecular chaperone DnaK (HSP70)
VRKYFKNKEINKSINQDEAVACGAALYTEIIAGGKN